MNRKMIIDAIGQMKNKPFGEISINRVFGTLQYDLILLTESTGEDMKIIELLASWRKKNEKWFPAQFPVTMESTKQWLKGKVIDQPDRLLFIIRVEHHYIGHIGLYRFDFTRKTCDIDNIIRGSTMYPGIMEHAIREMMAWGKVTLGLIGYTLETTSDNKKALKLYRRLHFHTTKEIPLIQIKKNDRIEWQKAPIGYKSTPVRCTVCMKESYE